MTRIVILGANGQVGRALEGLLGDNAVVLNRQEADLNQPERIPLLLEKLNPTAVINAAAYTMVDKAEEEPELAREANGRTPGMLAHFCKQKNIPFVHYSTDYVFDGSGDKPWSEEDPVAPLSVYGQSKLLGEKNVQKHGGKYLIFRTSWVYDATGRNFFNTMLRLGKEKEELRIVNDQVGAPTYAPHLAKATLDALKSAQAMEQFPSGVYHLAGGGQTTWFHFAEKIFEAARKEGVTLAIKNLHPIASSEYPTPATRPSNSRLDCAKALHILGVSLPSWEEGLKACMELKRESLRLSA